MDSATLFAALAPFGPFLSALWVGFAVMGPSGQLYLTAAGERYLEQHGGA